jgi:hypothetical protein
MSDKAKNQKQNLREFLENDETPSIAKRLNNVGGNLGRPPRNDPRHSDGSIPPGERNVPAGGSTGESMGGSAKQRKGQSG